MTIAAEARDSYLLMGAVCCSVVFVIGCQASSQLRAGQACDAWRLQESDQGARRWCQWNEQEREFIGFENPVVPDDAAFPIGIEDDGDWQQAMSRHQAWSLANPPKALQRFRY